MDFNEENFNKLLKAAEAAQESVAKLEANNQKLLEEKAEAKKERQKAIEEAEKAAEEKAKESGDVEKLTKSYEAKIEKMQSEFKDQLESRDSIINKVTALSDAKTLANAITIKGSESITEKMIVGRLKTEIVNGEAVTRVLDKDGNISALTLDELKTELETDPALSPIMIGSKANGSGDIGGKGEAGKRTLKRTEFDAMNPLEQTQLMKSKEVQIID